MKRMIFLMLLCLLAGSTVWGGEYQFISATDLKQRLERHEGLMLLDIQVETEFARHHIEGAVPTYAYPVKSETDRSKLDAAVLQLAGHERPVVIVCPRGEGGAKRTYDYLLQKGVAEGRLAILEGGQQGWPY